MQKNDFLKRLSRALGRLRRDEREKSLAFYREMIDDRVEAGLTEEAAVAEMEDIPVIAEGILRDAAARGALKPERNPIVIILLVIGSPLWVSLLAILFAVMAVFTACLWITVACLYLTVGAFVAAATACLVGGVVLCGYPVMTVAGVAASLVCGGIAILVCLFANLTVRGFAHLTGAMWRNVCRMLFKRRKTV